MLKEPTDEQRKIIKHPGNIVVTAKPGSGKTYTIVEKIASVLPGLPDYKGVIAISFTNKASDELKKRCKTRCADTKQSFFGTIDKFYISQIIIPFASHITGSLPDYKVILSIDKSSPYASLYSHKGEFTQSEYELIINGLREGIIFLEYTGETALYLLENVPSVIQYLRARFSHIIIDEYQDCGEIQNRIFVKLVDNGLIGIAVGDINQAIYGFAKRFPRYLISLFGRENFTQFDLSKNHRCHHSISEYSLCLYNASKTIPTEKRVFKVSITGDERNIAASIDAYIDNIKKKYGVVHNNQVAILCRSNNTVSKMQASLKTPCKVYRDTVLDKDESEWGRFFRDLLSSRFDENTFAIDYAEQLFTEEFEPQKYRFALSLCESIFSCPLESFIYAEENLIALARLVYPNNENLDSIKNLNAILSDPLMLDSYVPANENEINLMTLHKSKGLEFNIVFHMDMYKWIIPYETDDRESLEQDLNLHYVGVTRAKDVCYIMNGSKRYRPKNADYIQAEPSSFLFLPGLEERRADVSW